MLGWAGKNLLEFPYPHHGQQQQQHMPVAAGNIMEYRIEAAYGGCQTGQELDYVWILGHGVIPSAAGVEAERGISPTTKPL
jgi:hypothetical protein